MDSPDLHTQIRPWLASAYTEAEVDQLLLDIDQLLERYAALCERPVQQLSERDVLLITYGDQVQRPGERPLRTLRRFLDEQTEGLITNVHILPFYPYSSDDGFSVIDYYAVHPDWGDWEDISALGAHYKLMFDGVINHISQESDWFQGFLAGEERY
jgi:sucrose phosphorylase